jgi:sulfide:quinone oxidoreductase
MKRVSIIGAGFAALAAARRLRQIDSQAEITVIAPKPEFVFLPSLIWIPSGLRKPEDLIISLDQFFSKQRIRFVAAEATGLADSSRTVLTTAKPVSNDGLIIACGGRFIKKLPGIEHAVTPCEGIAAATKIRERVAALKEGTIAVGFAGNPQEPTAMRGGPMFEFLFGLDTQLRREKRREKIRLVFFNPMPNPGNRLGEQAVQRLLAEMDRRGIDRHLGHKMLGFDADCVRTEGGDIRANLILFMPGMTGNAWFDNTDLPRSPGGLIKGDARCRVDGRDAVYVVGDAASLPGPEWMPKQAHMAELQARTAAENLLTELGGGDPDASFKVELLCVVDSLDAGMLVRRTERHSMALPAIGLLHNAKAAFESWYLRRYR